jgi:phosphohistidine swiveling domain-containing protein
MTLARPTWILPLNSEQANLQSVGGKGANLSRLVRAGFPVPGGFIITTQAYQDYVDANQLERGILALIPENTNPEALEDASKEIRALFSDGKIPETLVEEIRANYTSIGEGPVAVRSSATAEDLPELSFAGQQDTYLNVIGKDNLLQAVVNCWSSLWTARAIAYRDRNQVSHTEAQVAVVIQRMVESQASGVLFTANPLSGLRSETVIDATLGLGEALVSGQVEPDHYVVDITKASILSKTLGSKFISIHGQPDGGTQARQENRQEIQALPDDAILALAQLGRQVAELYNFPQDIEWAWSDNQLYLLQSRPITSSYPLPADLPAEPLKVFFSFAAVQGMLDPLTPIGSDAMREVFAMGAKLFGVRVTRQTQRVLYEAGERLWINFTPILTNSFGRQIVPVVLELVEPSTRQAVEQIWNDPRLLPGKPGVSFHARIRLARFFPRLGMNLLMNLIAPRRRREFIVINGENILEDMERRVATIQGDRWQELAQGADLLPDLAADDLPRTLVLFISAVAAGMASWNLLNMLAKKAGDELQPDSSMILTNSENHESPTSNPQYSNSINDLILQVTRGMPYNPTTEMDLALWKMAKTIRNDPSSWQVFQNCEVEELTTRLRTGKLPEASLKAVNQFLKQYGGRGLGEIDLGRKRWAEDPTHVFEMLSSFLRIEDETQAPDVVFSRGAASAQEAIDELAAIVGKTSKGWLKARLVRFLAGRARQLMGARESPKFFAVRMMGLVQGALLKIGREFVEAGELENADDLFYLKLDEMKDLAAHRDQDWRALIANRRAAYQRELLRRQIPRLLISDGRTFYEGMVSSDTSENGLNGSPVSPGSVEGRVRVVFDPRQAGLLPGEILVCPGTDPSWTPLFFSAAGLIMEVGGMMTHGAVVAREYGIPAIVGVDQATRRLQTGQRIRMDGSSGKIVLLTE